MVSFKEEDCARRARYATGRNNGSNVTTPDGDCPKLDDIPYINYTEYSVLNKREWNKLDEMFAEFNAGLTILTPKLSADANKETQDT